MLCALLISHNHYFQNSELMIAHATVDGDTSVHVHVIGSNSSF